MQDGVVRDLQDPLLPGLKTPVLAGLDRQGDEVRDVLAQPHLLGPLEDLWVDPSLIGRLGEVLRSHQEFGGHLHGGFLGLPPPLPIHPVATKLPKGGVESDQLADALPGEAELFPNRLERPIPKEVCSCTLKETGHHSPLPGPPLPIHFLLDRIKPVAPPSCLG